MRWCSVGDANCSVARTLSVVGERWTMLILREAFLGRRRFGDFQRNTGIARNILAARLRSLLEHGIFQRGR
ncbi:MAG: winged helix-turn-helix transcriptional regulator, partial [Candidatus Binataceae bacterium]